MLCIKCFVNHNKDGQKHDYIDLQEAQVSVCAKAQIIQQAVENKLKNIDLKFNLDSI